MTSLLAGAALGKEGTVAIVVVAGLILLAVLIFLFTYGSLYVKAMLANAPVGLLEIIGMKLRGVDPAVIVNCRIMSVKAGLPLSVEQLETQNLARGNVANVVRALIGAKMADIPLTFNQACAIDLSGRDVLGIVQSCHQPVVIECPDPGEGGGYATAVARDGVEVRAKVRVTAKRNLERVVGGATEEGIIANVLDWLPNAIGCEDSGTLLENPGVIADRLLERNMGEGTCFDVVSLEVVTKR